MAVGIGGRLVMRLVALVDEDTDGQLTDYGATVGEITLGGVLQLFLVTTIAGVLTGRINTQMNSLDLELASPQELLEATFTGYDQTFVISAAISVLGIFMVAMFRKNSGKVVATIGSDGTTQRPERLEMAH